jgi:sugar-specific transcriptional regulator TrmB
MSDESRIYAFLQSSMNVTRREIASGSHVPLEQVTAILSVLIATNEVTVEGSANTAKYSLAGASIMPEAPAPTPYISEESRRNAEARRRGLEEFERLHPTPKPEPRWQPTVEEVQAELDAKNTTRVLTEAERKDLEISQRNRRPVNPNRFIV